VSGERGSQTPDDREREREREGGAGGGEGKGEIADVVRPH